MIKTKKLSYFLPIFFALITISCETENNLNQDDELEAILLLIDNNQLEENVLMLRYEKGELVSDIQGAWEYAWQEEVTDSKNTRITGDAFLDPGDEVCRGDGVGFARCVRDALKSGKCVLIYPDGDVFVAEEAECP